MSAVPKMAPVVKDKKHVGFLHQLVCVICGRGGDLHVHHLRRGQTRRGQYKAGDNEGLPLCPCHHNIGDASLHGQERFGVSELEYFRLHKIPAPVALATALHRHSGDYAACMDLIETARLSGPFVSSPNMGTDSQ